MTNAYDAAIRQANTPAALHLQEEEFDWIGGPGDFQAASRQRARFNGRAVVIRNERRTLHLAADPLALQRLTELAQIDVDQIGGPPVNRCLIAPLPLARASDFRFEIAGGKGRALTDLNRSEERRVGKGWVNTGKSGGTTLH